MLRCGLRWKSWYNEDGEAVAVDVGRLRRMSRLGRMQDVDDGKRVVEMIGVEVNGC